MFRKSNLEKEKISIIGGTYVDNEVYINGSLQFDSSHSFKNSQFSLGGPGFCYALQLKKIQLSTKLYTVLGNCKMSKEARKELTKNKIRLLANQMNEHLDRATLIMDENGVKIVINKYSCCQHFNQININNCEKNVIIASPTPLNWIIDYLANSKPKIGKIYFAPHTKQLTELIKLPNSSQEFILSNIRMICVSKADYSKNLERMCPNSTLVGITEGINGFSIRDFAGRWRKFKNRNKLYDLKNSNGAGEAFFSGFIKADLNGKSLSEAANLGIENAALFLNKMNN